MVVMKYEAVRELIHQSSLAACADALVASLRPEIGLTSYPWVSSALPMGASRLGGPADLPRGMTWPHVDSKPLALLAQLNFGLRA